MQILMGQLEKDLGLSTQNCEIKEKRWGALCKSQPCRGRGWDGAGALADAECSSCRLLPLCVCGAALPHQCRRCGSFFCGLIPLPWVFLCLQTLAMPWTRQRAFPVPLGRAVDSSASGSFPAAAESDALKYSSLIHTSISPLELRCARSSASV